MELFALVVAGCAVLAGLAAWRLSTGPVSLDFLEPYVEEGLASADGSYFFELGDLVVTWGGWSHSLSLQATDVALRRADGTLLAGIPLMELGLSAQALLFGEVAPTRLFVIEPRIKLRRDADGQVSLGLGRAGEEDGGVQDVSSFLIGLAAPPNEDGNSGYLREVRVLDGDVDLVDDVRGLLWRIPDANIQLERDVIGLRVDMEFTLTLGGTATPISASGIYNRDQGTIALGFNFAHLNPRRVADRFGMAELLNNLETDLSGEISVALDDTGQLLDLGFDLAGKPGHVIIPDLYPGGLIFESIQASGRIGRDFDRLEIGNALVDLGGPVLAVSGTLQREPTGLTAQTDVALRDLPLDDLDYFWPPQIGADARKWILEHLHDGTVREVRATLNLTGKGTAHEDVKVEDISGTIGFTGVTVDYLRGMPPARDVFGSATFDGRRFDISVEGGNANGVSIAGGAIAITDLDRPPERIEIDLALGATIPDALRLVDNPPLGYATKLDIDTDAVSGRAAVDLHFDFPLLKSIRVEDINPRAEAKLSEVMWRDVVMALDIAGGDLALDVDGSRMVAKGSVDIAGSRMEVRWRENFSAAATTVSDIQIVGRAEQTTLEAAGIDLRPVVEGPADLDLDYKGFRDGTARLAGSADLVAARMVAPEFDWEKSVGESALARFSVGFAGGRPTTIEPFTFASAGASAEGAIHFAADGSRLRRIDIARLSTGRNSLRGSITVNADRDYSVELAGKSLDASHFLAKGKDGEEVPSDITAQSYNLNLRADIDRVFLEDDDSGVIENVRLAFDRRGEFLRNLDLEASLQPGGGTIAAKIEPDGTGRTLAVRSNDAGSVMKLVGVADTVRGGRLTLDGRFDDLQSGQPLTARLRMEDFRVDRAPVLARILTLASFTGIVDVLSGKGISFDVLEGEFKEADGVYSTQSIRANGSALGITMNGSYDSRGERLDLEGTIVPAYFFNSLLGNIPILGRVLVGEKGGGVFAASYRVTGSRDDPQISVNPLTALLPGVLRNIFSAPGPSGTSAAPVYPFDEPAMRSRK